MTENLALMSASSLLHGYRTKRFSPSEAVAAVLERIERHDEGLNAFCLLDREGATAAARAASDRAGPGARRWDASTAYRRR
mgnify:CR=1 FL=1